MDQWCFSACVHVYTEVNPIELTHQYLAMSDVPME